MPTNLTQHQIRQHALQALFSLDARGSELTPEEAVNYALDGNLYENDAAVLGYVYGVKSEIASLDSVLGGLTADGWNYSRMTPVDKNILRLGAYEIMKMDTPRTVAIDEALNLAHDFSDDASVKFINAMLTRIEGNGVPQTQ